RLEATDGRMAAVLRGLCPDWATAWPLPDGWTDDALDVLVPAPALADGVKVGKTNPRGRGPVLLLSEDGTRVLFAGPEQSVETRLVEGKFPPFDQVFGRGPALFAVRVNPALLIRLLTAAQGVLESKADAVTLLLWGEGGPVGVSADGPGALGRLYFDGLVMPM